jgi:Endoglucanase
MRNNTLKTLLLYGITLFATGSLQAQLTPQQAVKLMPRGINIGNSLDAPNGETTWGNQAITEAQFEDYQSAGFNCIRIPVTWEKHISSSAPYTVDATFMKRVEQVVNWGLKHKLIIILNAHHEEFIKKYYTDASIARFDSLWSQVATRFRNHPDSLLFEIINEPNPLSESSTNALNARTLSTIRKTNPTRIVFFSGYLWSNSPELLKAVIPSTTDKYLFGYYHSYDPWPFGLEGTGTYGSDAQLSATEQKFKDVAGWSTRNNIPVNLGEFGFVKACEYNSRMCAYGTDVAMAIKYGVPFQAWDDGGYFTIYNRKNRTWNEIKDILIYVRPESPYKLKIEASQSTNLRISWTNRTAENDSIIVQRKMDTGSFTDLAKIAPDAISYTDQTTQQGKDYYYRLKTHIKDGTEIQSYPIMQSTPVLSGVPVPSNVDDEIRTLLQPGSDVLVIKGLESRSTLSIYGLNGKKKMQAEASTSECKLPVSCLEKGIYLLEINSKHKNVVKKFIKS